MRLGYDNLLNAHEILFVPLNFAAVMDRHQLGVSRLIIKGWRIQFELSERCRQAIEWSLRTGNHVEHIRERPGEVMSALTHELERPADRALDAYFARLRIGSRRRWHWIDYFRTLQGLSGTAQNAAHTDYGDDVVDALTRYEVVRRSRESAA